MCFVRLFWFVLCRFGAAWYFSLCLRVWVGVWCGFGVCSVVCVFLGSLAAGVAGTAFIFGLGVFILIVLVLSGITLLMLILLF